MNMSGGSIAMAVMMAALVVAYFLNLRRDPGMTGTRTVQIALIWVGIILGGYMLVSALTGMS